MKLDPHEAREIRDLANQLAQTTENPGVWIHRIHELSLELQARLDTWLSESRPSHPHHPGLRKGGVPCEE